MGLFSDRCDMLVDPATRRALSGPALEKARQDPNWPQCGNRVKKAARFCGKCGNPAPGGWVRCSNPRCGKWVGNESEFCWNCKTPLHPDSRTDFAGGVWQKPTGVFAQRFEVDDVKKLLNTGLSIQQGQAAILLDSGKVSGVLGPGRHDPESLARRVNWFGNPPPRSIIIVDNSDIVLPLHIEGLRTAAPENMPLEFYSEAAFHFAEKTAAAFVTNLFSAHEPRLTYEDLAQKLAGEVNYAVTSLCNTSKADDLVMDPQRRVHLENQLQETLKTALERYGLELVRVASAEFTGREYEQLREKSGQVEIKRRELEFDHQMLDLLQKDKMKQFASQSELDEYVAQLAQEKDVSDEHREQELALLRLVHRQDIDAKTAAFSMMQEMEKTAHDIKIKLQWDQYGWEKVRKDAEVEADVTRIWLKVKEEKRRLRREHEEEVLRIKREDEAARAKVYAGADFKTLIAIMPPEKADSLLKLHEQVLKQGQSPEAILALEAGKSPELARVLAEMQRAKREDIEKELKERKGVLDEAAARMERILKSALETTAEAAKRPGTQIIK